MYVLRLMSTVILKLNELASLSVFLSNCLNNSGHYLIRDDYRVSAENVVVAALGKIFTVSM